MAQFIDPPAKIPWFLKIGIRISKKSTGKDLAISKLLAWVPKAAIGSGMLEAFVAHHDRDVSERMLKMVRIAASFATSCPFCIDMNSFEYSKQGISEEELAALQGSAELKDIPTFSHREILAVEYARIISGMEIAFPPEFIAELKANFKEREIVVLATTAAQVNYWARLNQALGVPSAGFTDQCELDERSKNRSE
jgi:AhpD family alkylhydroperoxidase